MSVLGIELGSTRIKGVLIDESRRFIQSGIYNWENRLENGYWTYPLGEVWTGIKNVISQLDEPLDISQFAAVGISAMMHGYLVFDKNGELLVPFRTWRNTNTEAAALKLTELFGFNIPLRWSVAHLYQAILNGEEHTEKIDYITTLAGYVHWKLTGEKVLGICDASGMFPILNGAYNPQYVKLFQNLTGINWPQIAPKILKAGEYAGAYRGISFCPPEGDAGTGMTATNSVAPRTGNVSAGTSIFAMVVLEKPLSKVYPEIDILSTPSGSDVAMAHYNECTSKIDPWINLFAEAFEFMGVKVSRDELFKRLYESALGETKLSRFMRKLLTDAVGELVKGVNILAEHESVRINSFAGHGGFFKSGTAGQTILSELLGVPVSLTDTAAEGGAWGMALLADYMSHNNISLEEYLCKIYQRSN